MPAASNHHAARLVFQSLSVLIAEYSRLTLVPSYRSALTQKLQFCIGFLTERMLVARLISRTFSRSFPVPRLGSVAAAMLGVAVLEPAHLSVWISDRPRACH